MADDDSINWDNRRMFDRYLYDYMKKKNMHQAAEIFRREADVTIDPTVPISIDVPDGFLHEWWLLFNDVFKSRQANTNEQGDGPSMNGKEMVANGTQRQSTASLLQQNAMNKQTLRNLAIGADYGMTTGNNLLPLTGCPIAPQGPQQISRGLPSGHANVSLHEKKRNGKKPCKSKDGISRMRGVVEASSDASAVMDKFWDDGELIKKTNDKADGKGSSFGNLKSSSQSPEANAVKDGILLGGILVKYSRTSCKPHPSTCTLLGNSIKSLMT